MSIEENSNIFTATAVDTAGNTSAKSVTVYGRPPASPNGKLTLYLKDGDQLSKFPFPPYPPNTTIGYNTVYIIGTSSWIFPLKGDIQSGTFKISLLVGCYGLGQAEMQADLFLRHKGQSILLGSTPTFTGSMAGSTPLGYYYPSRKGFDITEIDPASIDGDTLIFNVTKVGGDRIGMIFIQELDKGHSTIIIPELNTSVEDQPKLSPNIFELSQNFPNPFNSETTIKYQLSQNSQVTLKVYNKLGQLVTTLVEENQIAGYHTIIWDGNDKHGRPVDSGVYLYNIKVGNFVQVRKMVFMR